MSELVAEMPEVPPVLPMVEESDSREQLLRQIGRSNQTTDENITVETEDEDPEEVVPLQKTSKKKLFFAFVLMIAAFLLLILTMSWFFGIGAFAASKPQAVDRTAKTSSEHPAPVSEEDKLKMALNLVAEKNPNANPGENSTSSETKAANSSVDVPSTQATDLNEPAVVRDPLSETTRNQANSVPSQSRIDPTQTPNSTVPNRLQNPAKTESNNNSINERQQESDNAPRGRSLFFGTERKEITETKKVPAPVILPISSVGTVNLTVQPKEKLPFGTLLPVRLLGAVYTLRSSGGLVRMELTRQISGKNYSYPAGTVVVGSLRGSEQNRAFISVVGLIDPATGGLVKFEGEVMGNDGASGLNGHKRQIKSGWSRVLSGLGQAGTVAIGAIGNRRSGGTVIISDTTKQATGVLSDELSGVLGKNQNANEFVEIAAGTTGFVLVTDLPDEISNTNSLGQNAKSVTGLSTSELADIFSEGNKEKIRALLPRMSPEFRILAEKYLAIEEK